MCSLLFMLPVGALGQTALHYVKPHASDPWNTLLLHGGMKRNEGGWYMQLPNGIHDLLVMNYVDGYSYGPHAVWGHFNKNHSRWELEETVRWAESRNRWVAKAELRYVLPAEWQSSVSVYGGQHMEDFDENPIMTLQQSLMATGIFGWNSYKLLERTQAGLHMTTPVTGYLQLTGDMRWERRRSKHNSRSRNLFGKWAESNVPRIRDEADEPSLALYEGPVEAELLKASLQLDLQRDITIYVIDDLTSLRVSPEPLYSLRLEMGQGIGSRWQKMRFLSLDLGVRHTIRLNRRVDRLKYYASCGAMIHNGEVGLADWHHLDASRFWWQSTEGLTRFALLDNYELSSNRWWSELHTEWSTDHLLFTRLTRTEGFRETLQFHLAKVAGRQTHWECQYGWDLFGQLGLGISVGYNNIKCAGVAFSMMLNLQKVQDKLNALQGK